MVRNILHTVTVDDLMQLWPPQDNYDYLYMPSDFERRCGGYAFINFLDHDLAVAFNNGWHGKLIAGCTTRARLSVTVARRQGMRANLAFWGLQELEQQVLDGKLPVVFIRNERQDARRLYMALRISPGEHATARASAPRPSRPILPDGQEPAARGSADLELGAARGSADLCLEGGEEEDGLEAGQEDGQEVRPGENSSEALGPWVEALVGKKEPQEQAVGMSAELATVAGEAPSERDIPLPSWTR